MSTSQLLDQSEIQTAITTMAGQIISKNSSSIKDLVIVGIRTRGVPLAAALAAQLRKKTDRIPPLGIIDITLYRDDLSQLAEHPVVRETNLPTDIANKTIILVDDVLYTGRTIRAALNQIFDYGRPRSVQLAVLIDRGGRELPIQADFVGLHADTGPRDIIKVCFKETDGRDCVEVMTP